MKTTAAPTTERLASIIHIGTRYSVMRQAETPRADVHVAIRQAAELAVEEAARLLIQDGHPLYTGLAWFDLCEDALLEEIQEACA